MREMRLNLLTHRIDWGTHQLHKVRYCAVVHNALCVVGRSRRNICESPRCFKLERWSVARCQQLDKFWDYTRLDNLVYWRAPCCSPEVKYQKNAVTPAQGSENIEDLWTATFEIHGLLLPELVRLHHTGLSSYQVNNRSAIAVFRVKTS